MLGLAHILTFAQFTLREAIKNRIIWIAGAVALAGLGLASFLAEVAVTEGEDIQQTLLAASYRFAAVFVMMSFVISTIVREFNDKCMDIYLSLPITRFSFFLGKCCGFALCGLLLSAMFSVFLLFYGGFANVAVWGLSLWLELIVVSLISFFCVLTFNQQIPPAFSVTFFIYFLCRSLDSIELISESFVLPTSIGNLLFEFLIDCLILLLPNLARFTRAEWLVLDLPSVQDFGLVLLQAAVYSALIGVFAMIDFTRKNL